MRPCFHIEIVTPKKVMLNGLWFGPAKAKRVIVWIHGLGSSAFTKLGIVDELVDSSTAVITFNNRGHDQVASGTSGRVKKVKFGAAHEIFTDCVDDIQGALNFARRRGARDVYLAGHSTGCQKSAYWAAKAGRGVKGLILLAPISDYAAEVDLHGKKRVQQGLRVASMMVKTGRKHELLSEKITRWPLRDAQRYLSLFSGQGPEEVFTYWDGERVPRTLRSIRKPILVLLAEKDEYADRSAKKIGDWFAEHLKIGDQVAVIPRVGHSFKGGEKKVATLMNKFMKER